MIKFAIALLCLPLHTAPAAYAASAPAGGGSPAGVYADAAALWLDGKYDDASGDLKYVLSRSSDPALNTAAMRDLAVLLAEAGKNKEALAYLAKGELLAPDDFYIQFEKGWSLLSLEKYKEARASFEKALTLTASLDLASQARFGLAITEAELAGPDEAIDQLRSVYSRYPYLLSPATELISADLERLNKRPHALNFIKEALSYDPRNIQAEIDLARIYEESGLYLPAWQTYYTLSDMDPEEPVFRKKAQQLLKYAQGKAENLLYWARMDWPSHKNPVPLDGPRVKLGLYADLKGVPSLVTSFTFITTSDFDIIDTRLGKITSGKSGMPWSISYNEADQACEIKDSLSSTAHATHNSVRIVPKSGGVILIKNPELPDAVGVNRGDKEVAGELLALAQGKGFWLINETSPEALVSPITASLSDGSRLPESLKAVAVTVRTKLARLAGLDSHESREYHLCDSAHCLPFQGLQVESQASAAAAADTRGEILADGDKPAPADYHRACGGFTAGGVNDGGRALPRMTPFNFYAYTLMAPPDRLNCLPEDKTTSSDVYWTLLLKPRWIESRLNRSGRVGRILAIIPLAREAGGKLKSMRVQGTGGTLVIEGAAAIQKALGAGMLRSNLFSIRPVFRGKYPAFFIVRGIGTGDGRGLCLLGARGMAKNGGARYRDILAHYFPLYKVRKGL